MAVEWSRGYYCAVAVLLRESGCVTPEVRSLYQQGGQPQHADPDDAALFEEHGLTPSAADTRKPCTCDGAGRGPGRRCGVQAGQRLGDLWRCVRGLTPNAELSGAG